VPFISSSFSSILGVLEVLGVFFEVKLLGRVKFRDSEPPSGVLIVVQPVFVVFVIVVVVGAVVVVVVVVVVVSIPRTSGDRRTESSEEGRVWDTSQLGLGRTAGTVKPRYFSLCLCLWRFLLLSPLGKRRRYFCRRRRRRRCRKLGRTPPSSHPHPHHSHSHS
jgi:hypothetical protein